MPAFSVASFYKLKNILSTSGFKVASSKVFHFKIKAHDKITATLKYLTKEKFTMNFYYEILTVTLLFLSFNYN